ncbi:MAG: hypothetical protein ACO3WU_14695 [Ilumatobacteraceae bacterium]
MKKVKLAVAAAFVASSLGAVAAVDAGGNGAPGGGLIYQLNIIGTSEKNPNMTGGNGHRIFVPLSGKTKINLVDSCLAENGGDCDFGVLDANGTDRDGATFKMPPPGYDPFIIGDEDPTDDTTSDYSVFVRPLGKPGGIADIRTCADVVESELDNFLTGKQKSTLYSVMNAEGELGGVCTIDQEKVTLERRKGQSVFGNVTAQLTSIVLEINIEDQFGNVIETIYVRVPLFDDILQNEYWEYDNRGLRIAQVRFYDCSTDVSGEIGDPNADSDCEI